VKTYDYVKTRREDVDEIPAKWAGLVHRIIKIYTRFNILVFKLSKGRFWKTFPGGSPICVVGMVGRKTGTRREVALIHLPFENKKILVGSLGGMETNPLWVYNLRANPRIDFLADGKKASYVARQVNENEKRDLWPHILSLYPDYDEYQARTDRDIPVFLCEPVV
jgi:deazaflavin-dependent oxidoreductase (nitroreductase family)